MDIKILDEKGNRLPPDKIQPFQSNDISVFTIPENVAVDKNGIGKCEITFALPSSMDQEFLIQVEVLKKSKPTGENTFRINTF